LVVISVLSPFHLVISASNFFFPSTALSRKNFDLVKLSISFSRSAISLTATDCTLPADKPRRTFRHNTGDNE